MPTRTSHRVHHRTASHKARPNPTRAHSPKPKTVAGRTSQPARSSVSTFEKPKFTARAVAGAGAGVGDVGDVPTVASADLTEAEKFEHYSDIITANGGTVSTVPGKKTLCGIRIPTDSSVKQGAYDDALAMLWHDKTGAKHVREYKFNTEPSPVFSGVEGVDVNHDGRKDLARLRTGTYEYSMGTSAIYGNVLRPTRAQVVDRDVSGKVDFTGGYSSSAGTSILFHSGSGPSSDPRMAVTMSAGCQTLPPDEMRKFWKDLRLDGGTGRVSYTLVVGAAP